MPVTAVPFFMSLVEFATVRYPALNLSNDRQFFIATDSYEFVFLKANRRMPRWSNFENCDGSVSAATPDVCAVERTKPKATDRNGPTPEGRLEAKVRGIRLCLGA